MDATDTIAKAAQDPDGLLGKLKHPVILPFVTSWLVYNWEVPYTLICGVKDPAITVDTIERYLMLTRLSIVPLLIIPMITTYAYLMLGPILANWVIHYRIKKEIERATDEARLRCQEPIPRQTYENFMAQANYFGSAYRYLSRFNKDKDQIRYIDSQGNNVVISIQELLAKTMEWEREHYRLNEALDLAKSRLAIYEKEFIDEQQALETKP
jgi:hypothetical protein